MCTPKFPAIALLSTACLAASAARGAPPRLAVAAPTEVISGSKVEVTAGLILEQEDVLSWSIAMALEGLAAVSATTDDTDFARLSLGGYAESHVAPDGSAVTSVAALSFTEPMTLPSGTSRVLRVDCLVTRKEPGQAAVEPKDGIEVPGIEGSFRNAVLVVGGAVVPLDTGRTAIPVRGCAALRVAPEGVDPVEPVPRVEVRRDAPVVFETRVEVRSDAHLQPTGLDVALGHDPGLLELDAAEFLEDFRESFVKADGFARVEVSAAGFAASVLSSAGAPNVLGPGSHRILRVVYRYVGGGRPGDSRRTSLRFVDDLSIAGAPVRTMLRPGDADPCSMAPVEVDLVVGLDRWIRGDADGDGRANISDAIHVLGYLFLGGSAGCRRAMELNGDGRIDLSDPTYLLNHLFQGGPPPAAPYPDCGIAEDDLPCDVPACPA